MIASRHRLPLIFWLFTLVAIGLATIAFEGGAAGQEQAAPETQQPETATESDMVFLSGEELLVSEATTDDLFAAGATVDANGAQADHLFLAGGEIEVADANVQDMIAIGGEIDLRSATIVDDIVVGGGEIVARPGFQVGGSAVLAGGTVNLEAPVGGDLRIGAGEVIVNSTVAGTARLSGDTIVLGPNARIAGDLLYRTNNLSVDPAAIVEGRREIMPMPDRSTAEDIGKGMGQLALVFSLSIIVSYFILVALLVIAVPGLMRSTSAMIQRKPWQSLGIGVIYALVVPVLVILLISSVFAAPLAVLLVAISVALTPIALAVTAHFLGMGARRLATGKSDPPEKVAGRILWPLLGVLVLFALTLLPLAGALVWLIAMLFGLGAFARQAASALAAHSASPSPTA